MKKTPVTIVGLFIFSALLLAHAQGFAGDGSTEAPLVCHQCGFENKPPAKFCGNCGEPLASQPKLPLQPQSVSDSPVPGPPPQAGDETANIAVDRQSAARDTISDTASALKAGALFEYGVMLFKKEAYRDAASVFETLLSEYPNSQYAEAAAIFIRAAHDLELREKNYPSKTAEKKPNTSFLSGFLGSLVGMGTAILLMIAPWFKFIAL